MDQKHAVEDVLLGAGLPGLMLEATMFMEEFWKRYTRPGLLKGTFTFSLPGDRCGADVWGWLAVQACCISALCALCGRADPISQCRSLCWPALLRVLLVLLLACRPLQLVAARDVGLAAANAISSADPGSWAGQRIPLAGDELTPLQMCAAFSKAQGGMPVKHSSPPAWIFWFLSRCVCGVCVCLAGGGGLLGSPPAVCRRSGVVACVSAH